MPLAAPERPASHASYEELPPLFRPRRRVRARRGVLRTGAAAAVAALAFVGAAQLGNLLPDFGNPFDERTVDRTGPAVLKAVADLHEYKAATGQFQVLVDLEKDARYLPSVLKGERTLFVAVGSVDATVNFANLGQQSIAVSPDGTTVTITLPAATLSPAHLDTDRSYVVDRDRGLLDRLGSVFSDNPTSERGLYQLAEQRVADAAAADDALRTRAQQNTEQMLRALLAPLGFQHVVVHYVVEP